MNWLVFALMTVVSWGVYGIFLHTGQMGMGDPANGRYKAFLFVGIAYFLTAVLAPLAMLLMRGADWQYPAAGMTWSLIAGIAGALYVPQVGIINPGEFAPANSIEAVIWTAIGGRGTLFGPILGAVLVNFAKSWFTGALPELWLFALGALFLAVTLFLPKGLAGLFDRRATKAANSQVPAAQPEAAE